MALGKALRAVGVVVVVATAAYEVVAGVTAERCPVAAATLELDEARFDPYRCRLELRCPSGTVDALMRVREKRTSCLVVGKTVLTSPMWPDLPWLSSRARRDDPLSIYRLTLTFVLLLGASWFVLGKLDPPDDSPLDRRP